jgi:hypothetical protein
MKVKPAALLLILCAGCNSGGYDASQMARLTAPERKVVGNYKLKMDLGAEGNNAELKDLVRLIEAMEGETTLECLPAKKFSMMIGTTPVTGDWAIQDLKLRLTIRQVGSMKPEEIAKTELANRQGSVWDMSAQERDKFLATYQNSLALERAESLALLRIGADGNLYADDGGKSSLFGSISSYFQKESSAK